jgi:hypothetical protein
MQCLHEIDRFTFCIKLQMATCRPDTPCVSSQSVLMSEQLWDEAAISEETGQQVIHVHHLMFSSIVF